MPVQGDAALSGSVRLLSDTIRERVPPGPPWGPSNWQEPALKDAHKYLGINEWIKMYKWVDLMQLLLFS